MTEPEIPLNEIVTHATVEVPLVALMAALDLLADLDDAERDRSRPVYDLLQLAARAHVVRDRAIVDALHARNRAHARASGAYQAEMRFFLASRPPSGARRPPPSEAP